MIIAGRIGHQCCSSQRRAAGASRANGLAIASDLEALSEIAGLAVVDEQASRLPSGAGSESLDAASLAR